MIKNHFASEYIYNKYKDMKTCDIIEDNPQVRSCPDCNMGVLTCRQARFMPAQLQHRGNCSAHVVGLCMAAHAAFIPCADQ